MSFLRRTLPEWIVGTGLVWSALCVLDPPGVTGLLLGPALCVVGLHARGARLAAGGPRGLACVLSLAFAVSPLFGPAYRADTISYYVYLRSALFDHDLDFTNDSRAFGFRPKPITPTGLRANRQSAGPAVVWTPFFLGAHAYVGVDRALGRDRFAADGFSPPYLRSMALGTITMVVVGAWLLASTLAASVGGTTAALAVAGTILTSTILYYAFVVPGMAHGATFGAAAALVWAWERARARPSLERWAALGALLGLVALLRTQSAVYLLLVGPLALAGLVRRTVRPLWLAAGALASLAVFSPQLVAWRILYGSFVTIPQGSGFLDWSSPHLVDVLISADHGFFSWTPAMSLGLLGLLLGLRRAPLFSAGSLAVFAAAAWVNGAVRDWAAGDAFGARRFDLVVPLMAVGLGWVLERLARLVAAAPLLVPAAMLLLLGLWNVGLVARVQGRSTQHAAPLERLASDQARFLRRGSERVLGLLAGPAGRALAYKYFVGEYLFADVARDGRLVLAETAAPVLASGWMPVRREADERPHRWARYPESCLSIPLEEPLPLPVTVTARALRKAQPQVMSLVVNGTFIGSAPLGPEWSEARWSLPAERLVAGENAFCLRFRASAPGREGQQPAAAVAEVRLTEGPSPPSPAAEPEDAAEEEP